MNKGPKERVFKDQWKTIDKPDRFVPLELELFVTDSDAERLQAGLLPKAMEDKWFVYFQDGWLYFHRSWTGALIYWLKFDGSPGGVRVTESYVSRQEGQYKGSDADYDRKLCTFLIENLLLNKNVPFPIPESTANNNPPGVFQHHLTGTGFPEVHVKKKE